MHWGIETCRSFLSYNSVLSILCICWLYVVNILCICRLYLVNILWICWLYVLNTSILCVCWLYVINIFCICCLYVVNSSIMFSLIWTLTIIRRRAEIVKCLAEFYDHPVPSTLSVAHILISSFFFLRHILCHRRMFHIGTKNVKRCILVDVILFILSL